MIVLVGQTHGSKMRAILDANGFGEMTCREEYPPLRSTWAFDNGAFKDFRAGRDFEGEEYEDILERMRAERGTYTAPMFLVVPDIVGGGAESLRFSDRWIPKVAGLAPLALAVQDGMTAAEVDAACGPYRWIFVGGTVPWKLATGASWVRFAHERGLKCHVGRVGTPRRVRWAVRIGADSIDSTQPLWSFGHMRRFVAAVRGDQGELFN